jgi:hypothetical protein
MKVILIENRNHVALLFRWQWSRRQIDGGLVNNDNEGGSDVDGIAITVRLECTALDLARGQLTGNPEGCFLSELPESRSSFLPKIKKGNTEDTKAEILKKEIKSFCEGYEGAKGGSPRARVGG